MNIIEKLKQFNVEVTPEMEKAFSGDFLSEREVEKKLSKAENDRDSWKQRAETAEQTLMGFEGKDFDAITRDRDDWKKKHDDLMAQHQKEQEDREFNEDLEAAITEAKGKNSKAIIALLDIDALRGSKNRKADMKTALDTLRTESGYLFEDNGGTPSFTSPKSNAQGDKHRETIENIRAIKDPAERQAAIAKLMKNQKG